MYKENKIVWKLSYIQKKDKSFAENMIETREELEKLFLSFNDSTIAYCYYLVNSEDATCVIEVKYNSITKQPNHKLIQVFEILCKMNHYVSVVSGNRTKGRLKVNMRVAIVDNLLSDRVSALFYSKKDIPVSDVRYFFQGQMSVKQALDFQRSVIEVYDFDDKHILVEILPVTLKLAI